MIIFTKRVFITQIESLRRKSRRLNIFIQIVILTFFLTKRCFQSDKKKSEKVTSSKTKKKFFCSVFFKVDLSQWVCLTTELCSHLFYSKNFIKRKNAKHTFVCIKTYVSNWHLNFKTFIYIILRNV
jgi:hypothetical protein